ncbi:MAG: rRNA maturation RNase YbeY [bacterium]
MRLIIYKQVDSLRVPRARLTRLFEAAVKRHGRKSWRAGVNLVFTTDKQMHELNREYRGKDAVTDVLSFNLDEPESSENTFGEVYISVATARRQAKRFGESLTEELLRLTAHGLLHLMGYTHDTATKEKRMMSLQEELLQTAKGSSK